MTDSIEPSILQDEIDALRAEVAVMTAQRKCAGVSMSKLMYAKEIAALKKLVQAMGERLDELERKVKALGAEQWHA